MLQTTIPFSLPDGSSMEVPLGTTYEQALALAKQQRPELYKEAPVKQKEGFFANVGAGAKDLLSNYALGIGSLGDEQKAREAHRAAQKDIDNVKQTSWDDVENAKGLGDTVSTFGAYARDQVARTAPYMAAIGAGAAAGSALGPVGTVGGAIAGGLGGLAVNLPAMYGSNLARQDKENPNAPLDKTSAALAAVPQAALDATSTLFLFGKFLPKGALGAGIDKLLNKPAAEIEAALVKKAQESILKAGVKGAAEGAALEMPTELAQQILERAQAGLPLTGDDANKEYKETLIGSSVIGGALGPYHGVKGRGDAIKAGQEKDRLITAAEEQAKAAQEEAEKKKQEDFKKTPDYLKELDQKYNDYKKQITDLQGQITALGKVENGTAEHAQKVALGKQRSELIEATKKSGLLGEWNANKAAITHMNLDPMQFMIDSAETAPIKGYGPQERPTFADPDDNKSDYVNSQVAAARDFVSGTEGKLDDNDVTHYAQYILSDPVQAAEALKNKVRIPDTTGKQNTAIWGMVKLQLEKQAVDAKKAAEAKAKADATEDTRAETEAEAKRARLSPETQPTDGTLPTEAWKQGIEQDNDVSGEQTHTADYAHNWQAERPAAPPLPGAPVAPEAGKVEAFTHKEYPATGEVFDFPKDAAEAKLHQAYTELRAKYQAALDDYQSVANTGSPRAVEARKTLAALSRALDDVASKINPTQGESTANTSVRPDIADNSGIDDLLNRALTPAAGNGPPVMAHELEGSIQRLHQIRRDLFTKFTDALSRKTALQAKLADIPDVGTARVRGQKVDTEDRWAGKRDALKQADLEVIQARRELVAAAIEEIKKQRELGGKLPHPASDESLAALINRRLDNTLAAQKDRIDKAAPKAAPGTVDHAKEAAIRSRMEQVRKRIAKLEEDIHTGAPNYELLYAELAQLDAEQTRLQGALGTINKEYGTASKERTAALDRQLATINARIRAMQTTDEKGERRITGGASAFAPSEQRAELARLKDARQRILDQQSMTFDDARVHQALQDIVSNLSVNENLPTRKNDAKVGTRKGATGKVNKLRELVLGGRKMPGHEVETGSTEFGQAYKVESNDKNGEEPFKASNDDKALVQRMREEELAQLNDAAKDPRYDEKTRARIDSAIESLHGRLNERVTREEVARAKEKYQTAQEGTGDLFGEGLAKGVEKAGADYEGAKTATTAGKSEVGRALGGMSLRSLVEDRQMTREEATAKYKAAKERLAKARENLPKLKQQQEAAREEVHAAVEAKVGNDAAEADANLKATQRSAAAVMEQLKRRRDAAKGEARQELTENMQLLTTLIRELREELRPQLAAINNEHGLNADDIKSAYEALMPTTPSKDAEQNAVGSDTANQMHEVSKELTAESLIDALERSDKQSMVEIDRLLRKIDAMEEDGKMSTGADLAAVQAKIADLTEKIRVQREWAAKIKKDRAPLARKIAGVEDAISQIKEIVSNMAPAEGKPMSEITKMVMAARETYRKWQDALSKADERVGVLTRHGVEAKKAGIDAEVQGHIDEAGKLQEAYYKELQAINEAGAMDNDASRKAAEAMEKRYEESAARAAEQQKLLESIYAPESRVETKGMWPKEKFGTAEAPPEPTVVRGKYGTAYYKDKSDQTSDARKAKADAALEEKATSGKPAMEFNSQREMNILIPENTPTEVREKLAEWLRAKGFVEAADQVADDAAEITIDNWVKNRRWAKENKKANEPKGPKNSSVVTREAAKNSVDLYEKIAALESIAPKKRTDEQTAELLKLQKKLENFKKAAVGQFNAAIKFGQSQTAIHPQRSKASSALKTGNKRGRPTNEESESKRRGGGEFSAGDMDAPAVETRVDPNTVFAPKNDADQTGLTMGQVREAKKHPLNGMTHGEAAQWVAARIKSPLKRALALRVAHFLRNAKGTIEFSAEFDEKGPGSYNNSKKHVTLSPRLIGDDAMLNDTLLHELTHAATLAGMRLNPMLRAQIDRLLAHAMAWMETKEGKAYAEAHPELFNSDGTIYGFKNGEEFVAEAFASHAFQRLMEQIPEQKKNVFQRFAQFLGRLFSAEKPAEITALTDVLRLTEKAMKETRRANEGGIGRVVANAGMYVGEKAELSEAQRILKGKAQALLDKGMTKEEVWKKTGWFQGGDGIWRVEISDQDVKATPEFVDALAMNTLGTHKLSELLDAPKLYAAYPDLKDMQIKLYSDKKDSSKGGYSRVKKDIEINFAHTKTVSDMEDTILHEIQHHIQGEEGFTNGTNTTATYLSLGDPANVRKAALQEDREGSYSRGIALREIADAIEKNKARVDEIEAIHKADADAAEEKYQRVLAAAPKKPPLLAKGHPEYPNMPPMPRFLGREASAEAHAKFRTEMDAYDKAVKMYDKAVEAYHKEVADYLKQRTEYLAASEAHTEQIEAAHEERLRLIRSGRFDKELDSLRDATKAVWEEKEKKYSFLKLFAATSLYSNKHGELEARDTSARKALTDAERRSTTPYSSTGVRAEEVVYAPKRQYGSPEQEEAASAMIGRHSTEMSDVVKAATGLGFRTRFIDSTAGLKEALKVGDPVKAAQVVFDLITFAQRNNVLYQSILIGAPERVKSMMRGKEVWMTESKEGANLKNVSKHLGEVKGFGNAQATSDAFTLYSLAKRAQTLGWDRAFADLPTPHNATVSEAATIAAENAKRAKARDYADTLANDANSPFKAAYKEYQDYNKGILRFAQQAHIISEDEFRRLASTQNYTPLFRADKKTGNLVLEIDQGRDITVGRLADEPHLHKLLGGSGQVMDFFTASVRNASVIIEASLHNIAAQNAVMGLHAMGAAHPVNMTEKGDHIIEFRAQDPKTGKVELQRFAIDTAGTKAGHIPTDLLVKGFAGVPASLPGGVRLMGVPAQMVRKFVTRNPLFMARQLIRDPMSGWLVTGADFNPVTDTLSELAKSMQGIEDKTLDRRGITGGALFANDSGDLNRIQDEAQKNAKWYNIGFYTAAMDHGAHAADAITRRNVYNGAIKEGASDIEATIAAYESMPFSKRGTSPTMRNLNHMVPFLSAAIQGWDVLYRAAKGDMPLQDRVDVRQKLLSRGMMIAGLSMMYALAHADDDDYENANTSERLNNWFVGGIKVPVPFELGIIFKMLPEALVRSAMMNKDFGTELKDVLGAAEGMVPTLIPAAASPVIEMMLNRSFYTGRDIEGKDIQNVDYSKRYDNNTSELSKLFGADIQLLGRQWGISPKMLEYMASQYTGGLYQGIAALIDNALPSSGVKPNLTLAQMPVFKSVLLQEDGTGAVNRLYEKIQQMTRSDETFKHLMKMNTSDAKEYIQTHQEEYGKAKVGEKLKSELDKFAKIEATVRSNPNLTPEAMTEAVNRIKQARIALAKRMDARSDVQ